MKAWRLAAAALACGLVAGACNTDLTLEENHPCGPDRECLPGYECDAGNICIKNLSASHGGESGNTHSDGGSGGNSGNGGTANENGGTENTPQGGASGDGGAGYAGTDAGYIPFDASVGDGGDACVPVPLYVDTDRDGYGVTVASPPIGCPQEGWAPLSGDCRDDIFEVNPGQTEFFGTGYPDPNKPDFISFDYDCANGEQPGPNNPAGGDPECQGILGVGGICSGEGYQPTARSGAGINALCGSTTTIACVAPNALSCVPGFSPNQTAFRCR